MSTSLLVYDGHCGFCKEWVERLRKKLGNKLNFAPYQEVAEQFPQIPREEFAKAVQLISPDGKVKSGAEAIFSVLAIHSSFYKIVLWKYKYIPGFAAVNEWVYRLVARNRSTVCSKHIHNSE